MKIKSLRVSIYLLTIVAILVSCNKDENTVTFQERDRTEQQITDKDSILNYLSTHYYNSGFFETGSNHKYTDIIITERAVDDEGNYLPIPEEQTLLINVVETKTTTYFDTDYEYYILRINQGGGESPKFTDAVRVRYEGTSLDDGDLFDATTTPEELLLTGNGFTSFGAIRAWQLILPEFNSASDFNIDGNGNVNFNDYGLGVMFAPSGLAYFSGTNTGSAYDNLIFKFELLQVEEIDHDSDGLPSYVEDLDNDLEVEDEDTDGDEFTNFIDIDDDGDDVLTINELIPNEYIINTNNGEEEPVLGANEYERSRSDNSGVITIKTVTIADSNNDGTPDYLDADVSTNYNEDDGN